MMTLQKLLKLSLSVAAVVQLIFFAAFTAVKPVAAQDNNINVEVIGGTADGPEASSVLSAFHDLMIALAHQDLAAIGSCLSPDVTMFDSRNTQLIHGRDAVLAHVQKYVLSPVDGSRISRIAVYQPFVTVNGDKAMVSFRAEKTISEPKPAKLESYCSEVYEKKDGRWQILHMKNVWRPMR